MSSAQEIVYDDLINVDLTKEHGVYKVRVLRKWMVVDYSRTSIVGCVNLVLIDKHVSI
jgi:hypothetical protein